MTTLIELQREEAVQKEGEVCRESEIVCLEGLVERSIRSHTGGLIRGLKVESDEERLIVRGSTDLFYHKQLATRAVMEVSGEITLLNEIEVCSH